MFLVNPVGVAARVCTVVGEIYNSNVFLVLDMQYISYVWLHVLVFCSSPCVGCAGRKQFAQFTCRVRFTQRGITIRCVEVERSVASRLAAGCWLVCAYSVSAADKKCVAEDSMNCRPHGFS